MKFICLDYGEKRTGYAASDGLGRMAFARGVIIKNTRDAFFADILAMLSREEAEAVVVGLPRYLDGTDSLTTRKVKNFVDSLKRRTSLPIYYMDEAYTSAEAESMLKESGQKAYAKDGRVDSLAAARILESFLSLPIEQRISA